MSNNLKHDVSIDKKSFTQGVNDLTTLKPLRELISQLIKHILTTKK